MKGYRKMIFGIALVIIGVVMDITSDSGLSANLMTFLITIGTSFFIGNGIEHVMERPSTSAPTPDFSVLEGKMKEVEEAQQALINATDLTNQSLSYILQTSYGAPQQKEGA